MSRVFDPFPIPEHQGLTPTASSAAPLHWDAIASKLVTEVLRLEPHEKVLFSADPYFGGAALEAMRIAVQRARGIELATILHWTPGLTAVRQVNGRHADAAADAIECQAVDQLFGLADVFILLMNDRRRPRRTLAGGQVEAVVENWRGRAVHLHWFHDPADPDPASAVNIALDQMYQRSILEINHGELARLMRALVDRLAGQQIRLTDPRGTDIVVQAPRHFHTNFGDASRERASRMISGRDREEEMPAGSFRLIPEPDSARGVVVIPAIKDGESPHLGRGFDCQPFAEAGLAFHYDNGRVVSVRTKADQARLDALWAAETGDRDRFGELVLGCNPALRRVPGSTFEPQYGFGTGVIRLILGDNLLSGGRFASSFHRWLMFNDASLSVGGEAIVSNGDLVFK